MRPGVAGAEVQVEAFMRGPGRAREDQMSLQIYWTYVAPLLMLGVVGAIIFGSAVWTSRERQQIMLEEEADLRAKAVASLRRDAQVLRAKAAQEEAEAEALEQQAEARRDKTDR